MAFIKKNIWLAFYFILMIWTFFLCISAYSKYKTVYAEVALEQRNIAAITKNSLVSHFRQYEIVLDVLAQELGNNATYSRIDAARSQLDLLSDIDSSIVSLIIFKPDGELFVSSSNASFPEKYNLLLNPESKDTFQQTLEDSDMVLGRTYYNDVLDTIVLPTRKAIRNVNGEVVYVLSLAISLEEGFDFIVKNAKEDGPYNTYLYRELDRYFQIAPKEQVLDKDIYLFQVSQQYIDQAIEVLEKSSGLTYEQVKQNETIVINELRRDDEEILAASIYINRYQLWVSSEMKLTSIHMVFLNKMQLLGGFFVISLVVIFLLFRSIAYHEKRKKEALEFQAKHDYLTKLNNRYFLEEHLSTLEGGVPFYLIYVDIDNFKVVNDNYGHEYGDAVLKAIADRLRNIVTKDDLLARFSGDEFLIISFEKDLAQLQKKCDEILVKLRHTYHLGEYSFLLSASIGVAHYPTDSDNPEELKRYADLAIYQSKKTRNSVTYFEEGLRDTYLRIHKVESELKQALNREEFFMVYQPQMNNQGQLQGVEALIRWNSLELGFVPPDEFISIAENSGDILAIGEFVVARSLQEINEVQQATGISIDLSINVSVKQFQQSGFSKHLVDLLKQYNFDKAKLVLEVTENVFVEDVIGIQALLLDLQRSGLRTSLDDFGTGYSSLSLLKQLPINELKIDKSFVDDMLVDENAFMMVEAVITIAKKLKMCTVAEGIETLEVHNALVKLGCDYYQGYYHARPLKKNDLIQFIEDNRA